MTKPLAGDLPIEQEVVRLRKQVDALWRRLRASSEPRLSPEADRDVLLCRVGSQLAAVPLEETARVVPIAELADLPGAPAWLLGLLNLGGTIVPVVDVAARLFGRPAHPSLSDLVVICTTPSRSLGLRVEQVLDVARLEARHQVEVEELCPPDLIHGTFRHEREVVLLLDTSALARQLESLDASEEVAS